MASTASAFAFRPPTSTASHGHVSKPTQPPGTFLPGTKITVGNQRVIIEKYLSEGGFAHVYVVRVPRADGKHDLAVLKRVAVPDKDHLTSMRTEVETMKKLKGHVKVVTYMDSHASQLKGGGYEVFLLMEFCAGGGLIDFMNTRLQHRLTEPEILKIFGDVAEGVACMHYLQPPLLHRDLKVENVLISKSSSGKETTYKLCDFGSAAVPRPAATTAEEGRLIEEDVQKHTTMQYRSPEMIDVWRKQPIDEKADIWALGVLLYKLCYYTTPFEDVGQMAILNASYKFPAYPAFSDRLRKLIGVCLKEDPKQRPNIYQVIKEVCRLRGTEVPIKDIYTGRTASEARKNEALPAPVNTTTSASSIGLQRTAPQVNVQSIPDIAPMRRGRPTGATSLAAKAGPKPTSSPARGDPFAALDAKNITSRSETEEELSKKYPSLDEFAIVHDKSSKFPFARGGDAEKSKAEAAGQGLNDRVAKALADEVFAQTAPTSNTSPTKSVPPTNVREFSRLQQPMPVRPGTSSYVSTGTNTTPPPTDSKPEWRAPSPKLRDSTLSTSSSSFKRPGFLSTHRAKSQTTTLPPSAASEAIRSPTKSSRPSLEGHRPPSSAFLEVADSNESASRARSAQGRQRPSSTYLTSGESRLSGSYVSSDLDFLRDRESDASRRSSVEGRRQASRRESRDREEGDASADLELGEDGLPVRKQSKHKKRASLPFINAAGGGAKTLAGRFGGAFKRSEPKDSDGMDAEAGRPITPPEREWRQEERERVLSPIEGSVHGTPGRHDRDQEGDDDLEETEDLPADVKRELERQRASAEEKRVADAAREYKARAATGGGAASTTSARASTIQKRVQSLLEEGRQSPGPMKRTAEGYGRFTDGDGAELERSESLPAACQIISAAPGITRKPVSEVPELGARMSNPRTRQSQLSSSAASGFAPLAPSVSAPPQQLNTYSQPAPRIQQQAPQQPLKPLARPSVPPKSQALRTGGPRPFTPPQQESSKAPQLLPSKPAGTGGSGGGLAALLAKDLEGVPDYPARGSSLREETARPTTGTFERSAARNVPRGLDVEDDFEKRYPDLSGVEMVETEIEGGRRMREREV